MLLLPHSCNMIHMRAASIIDHVIGTVCTIRYARSHTRYIIAHVIGTVCTGDAYGVMGCSSTQPPRGVNSRCRGHVATWPAA